MSREISVYSIATRSFLALVLLVSLAGFAVAQEGGNTDSSEEARPGLLVISHGSSSDQWNKAVSALVEQVRQLNEDGGKFHAIEGAFLEFAQPDAAAGIETLEKAGCDRIVVVPLFIAPAGHSLFDVPAVLGLYSSPSTRRILKEEGARVAKANVPVTMTQTLSESGVFAMFVMSEIDRLSKKPGEEAIVLIAHGSGDHDGALDRTMLHLLTSVCGQAGISYGDWAYGQVGQSYLQEVIPAIFRAGEYKKRVLVIGLYVSTNASRIHDRGMAGAQGMWVERTRRALEEIEVVFSDKGLVDYQGMAASVLTIATEVVESQP